MQLNFLDPEYLAELERQRHLDEEEHRAAAVRRKANDIEEKQAERAVFIKAPVLSPISPVNEKRIALGQLRGRVREIEDYFTHKAVLDRLEADASKMQAYYNEKLAEGDRIESRGCGFPQSMFIELRRLEKVLRNTHASALSYRVKHIRVTPAVGRLDELKEQIEALQTELDALLAPEPVVIQVIEDCEWSGQTLLCPHCPGSLVPQSPVTWTCTDDSSHQAWPHTGMMACRGLGGTRYWVPGMFDKVIPVAETPVLPDRYLHEPVCAFCESDLVQIAPQGWECASNSMHRFWVHHKCGVWTDRHGGSILKKAPDWAMEMVTV